MGILIALIIGLVCFGALLLPVLIDLILLAFLGLLHMVEPLRGCLAKPERHDDHL